MSVLTSRLLKLMPIINKIRVTPLTDISIRKNPVNRIKCQSLHINKSSRRSSQTFIHFMYRSKHTSPSGMDPKEMQGWLDMWEDKNSPWHIQHVHEAIQKHHDILTTSPTATNKIFVPLCGKSVDMKWLAEQGNDVVGLEASEVAVKEFLSEQSIDYITEDVPSVKGKLFRSHDSKIKIYCCDLFLFSTEVESNFSGIWDRGSLIAMLPEVRERYFQLMKTFTHPGIGYLLEMPDRDPTMGPPYYLPTNVIEDGFGPGCTVVKLMEVKNNPPDFLTIPDVNAMFAYQLTFQ